MEHYKTFQVSGVGKEILELALELNKEMIPNFNNINCFFIDKRGILVFCQAREEDMERYGYEKYPFKLTVGMMAEHILSIIESISEENLEKIDQTPSGYEEDYEYGWRVFIPEGTYWDDEKKEYNKNRISNYDWYRTVLAAYPVLIEYGK